jgi:uncharacterized membrane protein/heat shock protein HslJ/uncharacterized lipoprotein NlpE involved in copper resistance
MKIFTIAFSIFLLSCGWACKTTSPTGKQSAVSDSTRAASLEGTYIGMIPCADCAQISYRLMLNKDFTYSESMIYMGKSEKAVEQNGTFAFNRKGDIELKKSTPGMHLFRQQPTGLLMLDTSGEEIKGELAGQYVLQAVPKRNPVPAKPVSMNDKLWNDGVDFYARGNEPGWSLDMNLEKNFVLTTQAGINIDAPATAGEKAQDAKVTRYRIVTATHELIITITDEKCSDTMSGEQFTHKTRVEYRATGTTAWSTFEGCGRSTYNPALSGIWKLVFINDVAADTSGSPKGAPLLNIDPVAKKMSGHGGCNQLNGGFSFPAPGMILFTPLAATKMACPGMDAEAVFMNAVSEQTFTYQISDGILLLKGKTGNTLRFIKKQ